MVPRVINRPRSVAFVPVMNANREACYSEFRYVLIYSIGLVWVSLIFLERAREREIEDLKLILLGPD